MTTIRYAVLILCLLISSVLNVNAFNDETVHPLINEAASQPNQSSLNEWLISIGFSNGIDEELRDEDHDERRIYQWLRQGGIDEDRIPRFLQHFHDPTKQWEDAGLWEESIGFMHSSLLWAQNDQDNQASWNAARNHLYQALTNEVEQEREQEYVEAFLALGQVVHLVSDMAVPAHVRNDAHPVAGIFGKYFDITHFEVWTSRHAEELTYDGRATRPPGLAIFSHAVGNPAAPIPISALWDTDRYDITVPETTVPNPAVTLEPIIGLAEYTNANFFSEDTAFSTYYPFPHYPKTDSTVERQTRNIDPFLDGHEVAREYWIKRDTTDNSEYRLSGVSYNTFWTESLYIDGFGKFAEFPPMDEDVFKDYAARLIPRAVGYSAALIDYFFRGSIDIQAPFFSFGTDDDANAITGIWNLQIQNITSLDNGQTIEDFGPGELRLVYYYTPAGATEPVYRLVDSWTYQIDDASHSINTEYTSIDSINFDEDESIPSDILPEDITFLLVFRGQLGAEENAVAAQTFTGTTFSRIAYHHQPGGQPNPSNIFTISPDGSHPYQVTDTLEDTPWYFSPEWSQDGSRMAFENHFCTDTDPSDYCAMEFYFRNIVVINLLSEEQYPDNVLYEINYDGAPLSVPSFSPDGTKIAAIMQEQSGFAYNARVIVYNLETGEHWILNSDDDPQLTDLGGSGVAWSPAGDKIAYYLNRQFDEVTRNMELEGDLFLINPDGTGKQRLTNDDFINTQPSWSPDGEWIVFSSDRDGEESMDIWKMDQNGENLSRVVDCTPASCYVPTFSPDGQQVAFSNGSSIYVVNSNGDPYSIKEIANPGLLSGALNWSPALPPAALMEVQAATRL